MEQKEQICYCRQYLGRLESMQKDVMSESKEGVFLRKAASTRGGGYGQQVLTSLANKTRSGGNDDDGRSAVMCSTITFPPPVRVRTSPNFLSLPFCCPPKSFIWPPAKGTTSSPSLSVIASYQNGWLGK